MIDRTRPVTGALRRCLATRLGVLLALFAAASLPLGAQTDSFTVRTNPGGTARLVVTSPGAGQHASVRIDSSILRVSGVAPGTNLAAGDLYMSGANLLYHDGTASRTIGTQTWIASNALARNATDTSSAAVAGGYLYQFTNSSGTAAGGLRVSASAGAGVRGDGLDYGVYGSVTGASGSNYGLFGNNTCSGAGTIQTGTYGAASTAGPTRNIGVFGTAASATDNYGVYGRSSGTSANNRGAYGLADGGAGTKYGVFGEATGAGTNYGLYATASGGTTNWAGYFSGNTAVTGYVSITGASDSSGNLRFSAANPYIVSSSYFVCPGGAYFNSGTVYCEAELKTRGGIANDSGNYGGDIQLNDTVRFGGAITGMSGYYPANNMIRLTPNLHLNSTAGYAVIMNWDNGTTGAAQTFRIGNGAGADVFYVYADGQAFTTNWWRSIGATGWYNQTYGGGWWMADSTWIRTYGSKYLYCDSLIRADGGFEVDGSTVIDSNAGWHRTYGATGWYNGTYGGGWYMTDSTWVRCYNGKNTACDSWGSTGLSASGWTYGLQGWSTGGAYGGYFDAISDWGYVVDNGGNRKIWATGAVSEIVPTTEHGRVTLTCPEAPEYWYLDYGIAKLVDGEAYVALDPILRDVCIVDAENPMHVFLQVNSADAFDVAVIKDDQGFRLVERGGGRHSCEIDYSIVVRPKTNHGEGRFPEAPGPSYVRDKDIPGARAKNRPDRSKVFRWGADWEVYGYDPAEYVGVGERVPAGPRMGLMKVGEDEFVTREEFAARHGHANPSPPVELPPAAQPPGRPPGQDR